MVYFAACNLCKHLWIIFYRAEQVANPEDLFLLLIAKKTLTKTTAVTEGKSYYTQIILI